MKVKSCLKLSGDPIPYLKDFTLNLKKRMACTVQNGTMYTPFSSRIFIFSELNNNIDY